MEFWNWGTSEVTATALAIALPQPLVGSNRGDNVMKGKHYAHGLRA